MTSETLPSAPSRNTFQRVKTARVFEGVCDQIKVKLLAGELKAGDRLPAERDLAAELGVGRPAVREALRTLEMSGIVETRKGVKGGAYVREGSPEMLTKSFQDLAMLGQITQSGIAEVRVMINGQVIKLACERGLAEDFDAIEANIEEIQRLADAGELVKRSEAAVDFFRLLAKATRNDVLVVLVDSLGAMLRFFVMQHQPAKYRPELIPMRWNMLNYLRARDSAKAVAEMNRYLEIVHSDLRGGAASPSATPKRKPVAPAGTARSKVSGS